MTSVRPVLVRHLVVALVLALATTLLAAEPAAAIDSRTSIQIRDRVEYLINRERIRHGLPRVRPNRKIRYWAADHAQDMARRRRIYHDSRLQYEVPRRSYAWAENVGRTSARDAARRAMSMFMSSSSHRANILSRRMTIFGVGVRKRGNYTYIVQRFADWHR